MNNTTLETETPTPPVESPKPPFSKALAAGMAVAVLLIAVLSIAVVQLLPQAFSSLANLYETLHSGSSNDRTLTVSTNKTEVRSGEVVTLSWSTTTPAGTYTFMYECKEQPLAIEIRKEDGLRNVRCNTEYSIGETNQLDLVARTDNEEPATFSYKLGFLRTNDTSPRAVHTGEIKVVGGLATVDTPDEPVPDTIIATPDEEETPAIETPLARIETPQIPRTRTQTIVITKPVSDPNGSTDLGTRFISVGTFTGSYFTPRTTLSTQTQNALRFEVFNYGSKTSNAWSYTVRLPDGSTYQSKAQLPLRPNERTTITVGFSDIDDDNTSVKLSVSLDVPGDTLSLNDRFTRTVKVSR